jgi:hypothetical protein
MLPALINRVRVNGTPYLLICARSENMDCEAAASGVSVNRWVGTLAPSFVSYRRYAARDESNSTTKMLAKDLSLRDRCFIMLSVLGSSV